MSAHTPETALTSALAPHSAALSARSPISDLEARLVPVTPASPALATATQWAALLTVLFIGCLNTIDASATALSIPHIVESLGGSRSIQWAGTAYCIALAVSTILLGRCGDAFGRKHSLILGVVLMSVSHLGSATLTNAIGFFCCRAVAGMSSACIHTMTILMLADLVSLENRAKVQACLGAALGIGDCIGPLSISGFLQGPGWAWFYVMTSPILLTTALMAMFVLPAIQVKISKYELFRNMDYGGFVFITFFLVCLVLPLMNAGVSWKWSDAQVPILFVVSFVALVGFVITETRWIEIPIIPMRLLQTKGVLYTLCQNFVIGFIFQPMQLYIPLYFTVVKGITPGQTACMALAWVIPLCASSILAGFVVTKKGYKVSIRNGLILWSLGLFFLANVFGIHTTSVAEGAILVLTGAGIGFVLQPSVIAVQAQSFKADRSVAVTTRNVFKSIGGTLGVSISSLVYLHVVQSSVTVSDKLIDETKDFVLLNLHSKLLIAQVTSQEREIIGTLYTELMLYLFFIWCNVLSWSLVFLVSPLNDTGIESVDEMFEYDVPPINGMMSSTSASKDLESGMVAQEDTIPTAPLQDRTIYDEQT